MEKISAKKMVGKTIVSEQTGKRFGMVGDVSFVAESGELMNLIVASPTKQINELGLEQDEKGRHLVPFTSVKSVGDFVIISERDIV